MKQQNRRIESAASRNPTQKESLEALAITQINTNETITQDNQTIVCQKNSPKIIQLSHQKGQGSILSRENGHLSNRVVTGVPLHKKLGLPVPPESGLCSQNSMAGTVRMGVCGNLNEFEREIGENEDQQPIFFSQTKINNDFVPTFSQDRPSGSARAGSNISNKRQSGQQMQRKQLNFGEIRQRKESLTAHKAKNEAVGSGQIMVTTGRTHSDFVDNFCNNNMSQTAPLDASVISNISRRAKTPISNHPGEQSQMNQSAIVERGCVQMMTARF